MAQRDFGNVLCGPCRLSVDGTDLGHTAGETRLSVTPILRERTADVCGPAPVDFVHMGDDVRLTVRVA